MELPKDVHIVESVVGMWSYHLARKGINHRSLCGVNTMWTTIPNKVWDTTPVDYHLSEIWCKDCEKLALDSSV